MRRERQGGGRERKSNFHCSMDRINVKEEKACYLRTPDIVL